MNSTLVVLECQNNQLTNLNVSSNLYLKDLHCNDNLLTSINVSNNPILKFFDCYNNQLTSIDVSNNSGLEWLRIYGNQITDIDVSNNLELRIFSCGVNMLTSLDVSNNSALEFLNCRENQITHLNVSNNSALTSLFCRDNQLETIHMANGNNDNITHFTAEDNPNLLCIEVDNQAYSSANWIAGTQNFDFDSANPPFSEDCASELSLDETEVQSNLSLYPMPVTNILNIVLEYNAFYTVYSTLGKKMISGNLQEGNNTVNITDIQSGMYTIHVTPENGEIVTQSFIKQ